MSKYINFDGIDFHIPTLDRGATPLDESIYSKMSTDNVEVFGAFLGLTEESYFGRMYIPCKFKDSYDWEYGSILLGERVHPVKYFLLEYTVYCKECPSRQTHNRGSNISLYDIDDKRNIAFSCDSWGFASHAFVVKSIFPTKDLLGEDLEVRLLLDNVLKVSREEKLLDLCKKNL